jgi:hypothetical protein
VQLLLSVTGAAASTQLLSALAAHGDGKVFTAAFRQWVMAVNQEQQLAPDMLLLLVRLLPYSADHSKAT